MKRPFLISGIIGIFLIVVGLIINLISPGPSNDLPRGFITPVIAFEFATEDQQIRQIFTRTSSNEGDAFLQDMIKGTRLDYLFLLTYGIFLLSFSLTCARLTGNRLYYFAALFAIFAPIFDVLENMKLISILEQFSRGETHFALERLSIYTWAKWGSLALAFVLLIPFFVSKGRLGRFIAFFAAIPFVFGTLAYFRPGLWNELFALSTVVTFLLLVFFSLYYRLPTSIETRF